MKTSFVKNKYIQILAVIIIIIIGVKAWLGGKDKIRARVIDYISDERVLVVEDIKNRELRIGIDKTTVLLNGKGERVDLGSIDTGFEVLIKKKSGNREKIEAESVTIVGMPVLWLTSLKAGNEISDGKIIYGRTNTDGSEILMNVKNRRTGKYLLNDFRCQRNYEIEDKKYFDFECMLEIDYINWNIRDGDQLWIEIFVKNNEGEVLYKLRVPVWLSVNLDEISLYFAKGKNRDKDCINLERIRFDKIKSTGNLIKDLFDTLSDETELEDKYLFTNLDKTVTLLGYEEENGILTVDVSRQIYEWSECRMMGIYEQLVSTLKSIPKIDEVCLIVEGNKDERFCKFNN